MDKVFRFARFEADRARYQLWWRIMPNQTRTNSARAAISFAREPGKLVSRTQIVATLWGDSVFLDTERSINTAVRKIRKALKDDPHQPQFIETVVGQGYRFIASLTPEIGIRASHLDFRSSALNPSQ